MDQDVPMTDIATPASESQHDDDSSNEVATDQTATITQTATRVMSLTFILHEQPEQQPPQTPPQATPPNASALLPTAPTPAKRESSDDDLSRRSDRSTPPTSDTAAADTDSPLTLPSPITPVRGATPDSRMTSLSPTSMEHMTTRCTLRLRDLEMGDDGRGYIGKGKGKKRVAFAMDSPSEQPQPRDSLRSRRIFTHQDQEDVTMQGSDDHTPTRASKKLKTKRVSAILKAQAELSQVGEAIERLHIPSATLFDKASDTRPTCHDEGPGVGGPLSIDWTDPEVDLPEEQRGRPRQRKTISPATLEIFEKLRRLKKKNKPPSLICKIARDGALFTALVGVLPVQSLIDLYSISCAFHKTFNTYATSSIIASTDTWSPDAADIFPWRFYLDLCVRDPVMRQLDRPYNPHRPGNATPPSEPDLDACTTEEFEEEKEKKFHNSRDVPSLRWLQMVTWRHGVSQDIVDMMNAKSCLLGEESVDAIKRLWFAMDLPLNAHRQSLLRSRLYFPTPRLMTSLTILLKIDMSFTDPGGPLFSDNLGAAATNYFRHALLKESSFSPLWRVLHGWAPTADLIRGRAWKTNEFSDPPPMTRLDTLRLYAKTKLPEAHIAPFMQPDQPATACAPAQRAPRTRFMAMPTGQISQTRWERPGVFPRPSWMDPLETVARLHGPVVGGERLTPLLALDELLVGEMVRRQIRVEEWIWGALGEGFMPGWAEERIQGELEGRRRERGDRKG